MFNPFNKIIRVFCIAGLPGTGKTKMAFELSKIFEADIISTDNYRQVEQKILSEQFCYNKLFSDLQNKLNVDNPLVLDATFYKREYRMKVLEMVNKYDNRQAVLIETTSSEKTAIKRISSRASLFEGVSSIDLFNVIKSKFDGINEKEKAMWASYILIDTTSNPNIKLLLMEKLNVNN